MTESTTISWSVPPLDQVRDLIGHATAWETVPCEKSRARQLTSVSGLASPPYVSGQSGSEALLPPTYLVAQHLDADYLGVPDAPSRLNGGNRCRWYTSVTPDTLLERRTEIADVATKQGRSGTLLIFRLATWYRQAQTRDIVATSESTTIRRYPDERADTRPAASQGGEGATAHVPDDATEALRVTPSSRDLIRYAASSNDFYEIHYDHEFAIQRGMPGVVVHGLLKLAYLARTAADWGGDGTVVMEVSASYRGLDLVSEPFTVLVRPSPQDEDHQKQHLQLFGVSARGQLTTSGEAFIVPPSLRRNAP